MRGISKLWQDFSRDQRGSFAVAGAIATPMLALAIGYAINVAQLVHSRSNLQNALDAAITSTARDLTTGKIKEKDARESVENFLASNAARMLSGSNPVTLRTLTVDRVMKTVEADAFVDADMFFPLFGVGNRQRINVDSAALYSDKKIEVVMMLDITGSMKGKKIEDLKTAAENAVDGLLKNADPKNPRVRLSIVPYAEAVNVGKLANTTVFRELANKSAPKNVLVKGSDVDLALGVTLVSLSGKERLKPAEPDLPPPSGATSRLVEALTAPKTDNCATERKLPDGTADFSDAAPDTVRTNLADLPYLARVNRDDRLSSGACPNPAVVPLTADADALKASIAKFTANGYTAGGIALQWGAYMLSPEWRDTVRGAGLGDGAADYDAKRTAKVAILMTDGVFNTAFTGDRSENVHEQFETVRDNAEGVCDAMKANGVQVFTLGFALPVKESNEARKLLKGCASADTSAVKHFYDVASGEELNDAFQEIIANAERLAVTK